MDLRDTPAEAAFRRELRTWLAEVLPTLPPPPAPEDWAARRAYDTGWQRMLYDAGYAGLDWPKEYGGRGATPVEHLIFLEETEAAGAPYVGMNFVGLGHAGPTIIAEGTDEQRRRYLPPILRGEEVWCQGFSEPEAGSDLASLRTRAVREGDHYVVEGHKIWTSFGHVADLCELLVRTDPDAPKHRGLTWLIMPMDLPGIEVRPLKTMAGSEEFCELFLDGVRIPVANRVGAENDGWRVAMVTFSFERGTAFVSELLGARRALRELIALADPADTAGRAELAHIAAHLDGLWGLVRRMVSQASAGRPPGLMGSVFKLDYAETRKRMGRAALRVLGRAGLTLADLDDLPAGRHIAGWIHAMSISIAAGTSQIQRDIIGERLLGLPKGR